MDQNSENRVCLSGSNQETEISQQNKELGTRILQRNRTNGVYVGEGLSKVFGSCNCKV